MLDREAIIRIVNRALIMFALLIVALTGLYWFYPGLVVKFSPSTSLAYMTLIKVPVGKEWEDRMRQGNLSDYKWLLRSLADMSDDRSRYVSAWSLGIMGNRKAVPFLVDRLQNDSNSQVRYTSARAIGDLKAKEAIQYLIAAINDGNTTVRNIAVDVLGDLGAKEAIPEILKAKSIHHYPSMQHSADAALKKLE